MRPFQSQFSITAASDVVLDAWHGARSWALSPAMTEFGVTAAEYNEKGADYLKEHCLSNRYVPSSHIYAVKL